MFERFLNQEALGLWGAIITLVFSLLGVWFNLIAKKHNETMLFNDIIKHFFEIQKQLKVHTKEKTQKWWDDEMFNFIEYLCYHANRSRTIYKHTKNFMSKTIIMYRDKILKVHYPQKYDSFEEWKILYEKLKNEEPIYNFMKKLKVKKIKNGIYRDYLISFIAGIMGGSSALFLSYVIPIVLAKKWAVASYGFLLYLVISIFLFILGYKVVKKQLSTKLKK